jgi:hypothetical protein
MLIRRCSAHRWPSPRAALGAAVTALSFFAAGCASTSERIRAGSLDDAWDAACEATDEDSSTPLPDADQAVLRRRLLERTRVALSARTRTPEQLAATLGEPVFRPGALLVVWRLDAIDYPGTGVTFEPQAAASGSAIAVWHDHDVWTLAGVEPPVRPTYDPRYSEAGALLDGLVALFTGGVAGVLVPELSPKFRGTDEWLPKQLSPGSPGTGSRVQTEVLALLEALDSKRCEATVDEPCERALAMGPGAPPKRRDPAPGGPQTHLFLGGDTPPGDALVVRLVHQRFSEDRYICKLGYDVVLPLAPGASLAQRLDALFARGPVMIGPAARAGNASR